MVKKWRFFVKRFFYKIEAANRGLFRSAGIIFLFLWIEKSQFFTSLDKIKKDKRQSRKILYKIKHVIVYIILHILDGDQRISQYERNPNKEIFLKVFYTEKLPDKSTVLNCLKKNKFLIRILGRLLFQNALNAAKKYCNENKKRYITIDVDQTAREIHGKQQRVSSGYFAGKRNSKLYQIRVYTIRELKITLRIRLLKGSAHSSTGFRNEIMYIADMLKKAGIKGFFVGDSGFESGAVCDYLHENGHKFIFAEKMRKDVIRRGKYSKNKKCIEKRTIEIKERQKPVSSRYKNVYREIFVKVLSNDGQLWFDFASDQFTNVFVTNAGGSARKIYSIYRKHAVIETIIEELKNDFGAGLAHSNEFHVNSIMTICSGLSYNIKSQFLEENEIYIKEKQKMKLSTFQSLWIHTPGMFVKRANRVVLKIAPERFNMFYRLKIA
jgi:hypothetical protein